MHSGQTKQDYRAYPAIPYPSFLRLSDGDMHALYAYPMHGLQTAPTPKKIGYPLAPFDVLLTDFLALDVRTQAAVVSARSRHRLANLARGAYLVQGLGHCGACHTARGISFQKKVLSDQDNNAYLAVGSALDS